MSIGKLCMCCTQNSATSARPPASCFTHIQPWAGMGSEGLGLGKHVESPRHDLALTGHSFIILSIYISRCALACTHALARQPPHTDTRPHLHQQLMHPPTHACRRAYTPCGSCAMCLAGPQGIQGEDGWVPEGGEEIGGLVCSYQPLQAQLLCTFEQVCGMCPRNGGTLTHHPASNSVVAVAVLHAFMCTLACSSWRGMPPLITATSHRLATCDPERIAGTGHQRHTVRHCVTRATWTPALQARARPPPQPPRLLPPPPPPPQLLLLLPLSMLLKKAATMAEVVDCRGTTLGPWLMEGKTGVLSS
jgi:hypothetical protein